MINSFRGISFLVFVLMRGALLQSRPFSLDESKTCGQCNIIRRCENSICKAQTNSVSPNARHGPESAISQPNVHGRMEPSCILAEVFDELTRTFFTTPEQKKQLVFFIVSI